MTSDRRSRMVPRRVPRGPGQAVPKVDTPASPLWAQLRRLVIGVGIGLALLVGGNLLFMPMLGRSLTAQFEGPPVQTALDPAATANETALSDICPAADFGVRVQTWESGELNAFEVKVVHEGQKVQAFARHVACNLITDLARLCKPQARRIMAHQVRTYLAMRRDGQSFAEDTARQMHARSVAPDAMRAANILWSRSSRDAPSDVPAHVTAAKSLFDLDSEVLDGLRSLIRFGYLSSSDFSGFLGLSMPVELGPIFDGIQPETRACS